MTHRSPIAVVGMAGLFPGAFDLHAYWQNIINKFDAAKAVPEYRWIANPDRMVHFDLHPDKALSRRCCLIDDFRFDPTGIEIDPDLITALDPLYHVILHTGKAAISEPVRLRLKKERTGVVLAAIALPTDASSTITRQLFGSLFEEKLFGQTEYTLPGTSQSLAAKVTSLPGAILAKGLGLGGGFYTLDAACASSIYAVKLACDALQSSDSASCGHYPLPDVALRLTDAPTGSWWVKAPVSSFSRGWKTPCRPAIRFTALFVVSACPTTCGEISWHRTVRDRYGP
jgi:acyl transferase domain-containing protein